RRRHRRIVFVHRDERVESERARAARAVHERTRAASRATCSRRALKSVSAPTGTDGVDIRRGVGRIPGFADGRRSGALGLGAAHLPPSNHHSATVAIRRGLESIVRRADDALVAPGCLTYFTKCYQFADDVT